mmetsp:Transcript_2369/g.7882  ORF Transcript_2369/g.7882 Transcript_2369/m.7882 type:complete len:339 (+) Transcript_2369:112-1128(+)
MMHNISLNPSSTTRDTSTRDASHAHKHTARTQHHLLNHAHEKSDTGHDPLVRVLFCLQAGSEDVRGPAELRLVDGARILVTVVGLLDRNRLNKNDRQLRIELLHVGILEHARRSVPSRPVHIQAVHIGSLTHCALNFLRSALRHVYRGDHTVERPLILAGSDLHHRGKEGLGVEESRDPGHLGRVEIGRPLGKLLVAVEEIEDPHGEWRKRWPGQILPPRWYAVGKERVHQVLHRLGDGEVAAQACIKFTQRAAYLEDELVHPLTLLQEEGNVRRAFFRALLDLHHEEELGQLLKNFIELLLDTVAHGHATLAPTAARLQLGDGTKEFIGLPRHEVDL